ncbi:crosslink repair DNA glycosylase YcaQ family protein [Nocardioides sp. InS609-2]|uniref:DNA glycosylase AlkZ-like family protein n=1 Tax=Nocardioides sp. InS609-2 TaxID=2760705 RepID=UPI0020BDCC10|nr:crosslink repair DNA glycosylase YcaQ family protein [Nocardioides sp. InS609-2]
MTEVHQLSRTDARRIAVRAQLLASPRPTDVLDVVRHLTLLQHDPVSAVAPSADLVLWSRLGSSYSTQELRDALDRQELIDHRGLLRPAEDIALYRADMANWPGPEPLRPWQHDLRDWVEANDACRLDILERLRGDGPLPISELPDSSHLPWASSGWNNDKNVQQLLKTMVARGEVATAGRDDRERLWDLAERIYPDDPVPDADEAKRLRDERRLLALGIARARGPEVNEDGIVGDTGEPAVVEGVKGVKGEWRVDPTQLGQPFKGRAALLSPLDRLVYDRKRMDELFEFDYTLEMYKPAATRIWGYYALPILYGDRLVGKLDGTADRKSGVFRINAIHQDVPFTLAMTTAVDREIADLATWLELELDVTSRRTG